MDWDDQAEGATPLPREERDKLKQSWIVTMGDLNEAEAENILVAATKWYGRRNSLDSLLDDKAVRDLHRDMLGDVWTWAGTYRSRTLNIGVDAAAVPVAVRDLVDDARFWFAADSVLTIDAAAVRFHHQLVAIHPFANGNGRHARLLTDLLLRVVGAPPFTWGSRDLAAVSEVRKAYIAALRQADRGEYAALVEFARS
ncbi:cell division protein Fic [Knoellia sinensis KCTC 19936]|uniref:Cell division protein Fic n=1 Tax=Knoellia sinensis KCTC 19936 TaxID=1385520 RepID=A0A0A0J953_9MICO|nr:mobile mystery protein B [Knoellia sinensis]KGN32141.1 cell division protein Fic [Knoellia sinensis KCTC 19936]